MFARSHNRTGPAPTAPDPRIDALRRHLGDVRFLRFVAKLRFKRERLLFWQSEALDRLEQEEGIVFPRDHAALAALLLPSLPPHPSLPREQVPEWIVFDELGGEAPVQGTGRSTEPAARFYFRARHEIWSLGISIDPDVDPVDIDGTDGRFFYHEEPFGYESEEASRMPLDVARFFIVRELVRWRHAARDGAG